MKRHVSLVVIPIDDLTSQVIKENYIRPSIQWEKPPIWKQGFYVFVNVGEKEVNLHIESQLYQSQNLHISLEEGNVKKIRLVPSELYGNIGDCLIIRGTGTPGETVGVYSEHSSQHFKLLRDYHKGEQLGIFNCSELDLSGRKLFIKGREKNWTVTLGELSEEQDSQYQVKEIDMQQESERIRKVEATVYLYYETKVRENGTFYLLMPKGKESEFPAKLCYQGEEREMIIENEEYFIDLDRK